MKLKDIWRKTEHKKVELRLNRSAIKIDPKSKSVTDNTNEIYYYDKLLIATGCYPRHLRFDIPDIIYLRKLVDYEKIRMMVKKYNNFGIIGGGFIGAEIAAALRIHHKNVTIIFPEVGICGSILPENEALYLNQFYKDKGIIIHSQEMVKEMIKLENKIRLLTSHGEVLIFDCVIAGTGVVPNTCLAETIGIKIENGIRVDEYCQTSIPDIYAAGDVASFENTQLGTRIRVEHEDNANNMGEIAGKNMTGVPIPYDYLPFFYSDLFEISYEAVGEINPQLEIVYDWKTEHQQGIIYYCKEKRVKGVLCWNIFEQMDDAREIIARQKEWDKEKLKDLLPRIQKEPLLEAEQESKN
jgi:NAD(P)H-nitrite reductase large subunit